MSSQDHSKYASFACVILSHGEEGVIYGTDGPVLFDKLIEGMKGNGCRTLVGKPKLFFIQVSSSPVSLIFLIIPGFIQMFCSCQACRGSLFDEGLEIEHDAREDESEKIPLEADFLYAYSTTPGIQRHPFPDPFTLPENSKYDLTGRLLLLEKHRQRLLVHPVAV